MCVRAPCSMLAPQATSGFNLPTHDSPSNTHARALAHAHRRFRNKDPPHLRPLQPTHTSDVPCGQRPNKRRHFLKRVWLVDSSTYSESVRPWHVAIATLRVLLCGWTLRKSTFDGHFFFFRLGAFVTLFSNQFTFAPSHFQVSNKN